MRLLLVLGDSPQLISSKDLVNGTGEIKAGYNTSSSLLFIAALNALKTRGTMATLMDTCCDECGEAYINFCKGKQSIVVVSFL
jgi:hypothetical protein